MRHLKEPKPSLKVQKGIATLLTAVVLGLIAVLVALSITQTSVVEIQITANDVRAQEAIQGAEGILDYGMAWAKDTELPAAASVTDFSEAGLVCDKTKGSADGCPNAVSVAQASNSSGETYDYELTFKWLEDDEVVKVESRVWADGSNIEARTESFLVQSLFGLFNSGVKSPPPFVLDGCYGVGPSNTGDLYMLNVASAAVINSEGSNCEDTQIEEVDNNTWIDANNNKTFDAGDSQSDESDTDFIFDTFTCGNPTCVWNHYFDKSIGDAKLEALESSSPTGLPCGERTSTFYYMSGTGNINNCDEPTGYTGPAKTIGSPNTPVILIVNSNDGTCPKFNGGIVVYGIVYVDGECDDNNGWGNATIYGSIMIEGPSGPPSSNQTDYFHVDYGDDEGLNEWFGGSGVDDAARIPGTWKDF